MEEKNNELEVVEKKEVLDTKKYTNALSKDTEEILSKIAETNDANTLKDLTQLFNLNQFKKNLVRINKMNDVLDRASDEASTRISNNPYDITDKDLLNYINTMQSSIEKSYKMLNGVEEQAPIIQILNNSNDVNINVGETSLNEDSKNKILDVVKKIMAMSNNQNDTIELNPEGDESDE